MMDLNFSGCWILLTMCVAAFATLGLFILKLCGVLLLSWWWVCAPVPIGILLIVLFAGACALLEL